MSDQPGEIAIVGAGLSGLSAALSLASAGRRVRVFDKGRGPGGRLSTRRAGDWRFDHGGQFLTARDEGFRTVVEGLVAAGRAAPWTGRVIRLHPDGRQEPHAVERFVGVPGMSGIIQGLVALLPDAARPHYGLRVTAITGEPGGWYLGLEDAADVGPFTHVVLALPAPQAAELLRPVAPGLADHAARAAMAPCWALLLGFSGAVPLPGWDAAFIAGAGGSDRPLSWIAHDGSKPGRGGVASFVAHAAPVWSQTHLDDDAALVAPLLLAAFRAATGIVAMPDFQAIHRWRYALPTAPLADGFLLDAELGLGACGDWCLEARAEAAFVSGRWLAAAMGV